MKKFAVIVAGGSGLRMGMTVPKQFLMLGEHPVLWYTLETFLKAYEDLQIILVGPAAYEASAMRLLDGLPGAGRVELVNGGDTRFHSVRMGLERLRMHLGEGDEMNAIIFVHDGVRCLVSAELIRRCYDQALRVGSAIPAADCRDSVRLAEDEGKSKPIDRSRIKLVQTPQTFRADILLNAYLQDHQEAFTDEATVVEVAGQVVYLIEGESSNIKITTPQDMVIAEAFLKFERRG